MSFSTGASGNPAGRKKGSENKATAALRARVERVQAALDLTLSEGLKALQPQQRVELGAKLQEDIRPKLSRTAVVGEEGKPVRGVVRVEVVGNVRPPTTREQDVSE